MNTRNVIFDKYLSTSFNGLKQSPDKIKQFEFNYAQYMPENRKEAFLLDIGVGRGEMLTLWKKMGYANARGIDISIENINFCRSLGSNVELMLDTKEYLDANKNRYDLITFLDVIEHFPKNELIDLLISLKNSLKSEGKLIIQTPNMVTLFSAHHRYNDITHEFGLNEHSFRQLLIGSGFNRFEIKGFEELRCLNWQLNIFYGIFRDCLLWPLLRILIMLNGIRPQKILHPVFYCVASKI